MRVQAQTLPNILRRPRRSTKGLFVLSSQSRCMASSWSFPTPPPPPSQEDIQANGLPLLQQAARHAKEKRILLSEWPQENKDVQVVSYASVLSKASAVASFLDRRRQESSKHSSKFVAHSNVPGSDYIACQWGAFGAGMTSVPLATSQKVPELEHVLEDANPRVILIGDHPQAAANQKEVLQAAENVGMADRIVHLQECLESASNDEEYWLGKSCSDLDTPAILLYTSGTTGKPKGVVHTHRNLFHQVTDLVTSWEWQPDNIALHMLPLHHVHGVVNVLSCAAYAGARLQFQPFHAQTLWKQWTGVENETTTQDLLPKPNILMAVPTIYAKLLEAASTLPPQVVETAVATTLLPMRLMVSGSAALPVSILHKWKDLTGHTLLERYGMTEFAMALSNPYRPVSSRQPGHVGLPLPSVQVRLVDESTGQCITSSNTAGALQVKGPTVFAQYLNRPEATAEAFTEDGYFETGDVAEYNDTLESWRILGRASVDIIKTGGHKLSALEIERELLEYPGILEVIIVGIPGDEIWGESVGMIGRLKPETKEPSLQDIRTWSEPRMAKHKLPTRLLWVQDIPKNAMGKVNKKELLKMF
jgi:malonyl-CoA/methylmalonyl-CoA synthetase